MEAIQELDRVISSRDKYVNALEARADSLRTILATAQDNPTRWLASYGLYRQYKYFSVDSARFYAYRMNACASSPRSQILSNFALGYVHSIMRDYDTADEYLRPVELDKVPEDLAVEYFLAWEDYYVSLRNDILTTESQRREYSQIIRDLRKESLSYESSTYRIKQNTALIERARGDLEKALQLQLEAFDLAPTTHDKAQSAYSIAVSYRRLGNREEYEYWLARCASNDLRVPIREYRSLYDLAVALYEDGDTERASRYIQTALMDALACNYNTRIINSALTEMIISNGNVARERLGKRNLILVLLLLAALIAVIFFLWRRSAGVSRALASANTLLTKANAEISTQNMITENYLFRYMQMSASFTKSIDEYRHNLIRAYRSAGPEEMLRLVRSPDWVYMQYDDFYRMFDEIFLGIFPDFVSRVNELLSPEGCLVQEKPEVLTTELRVLAVIRLGMRESGKIASFLNIAPQTVYSYRTRAKNHSLVGRDAFEDAVRRIAR